MADKNKDKARRLTRRRHHVRQTVFGTPQRPRLSVYRSSKHIYAQLIDDYAGRTLASVATTHTETRGPLKNGGNIAAARQAGRAIAEKAKQIGVTRVSFDRGGRKYHGRVKALADAAREGGLQF